jgi:DNA polymerase III subunit delta
MQLKPEQLMSRLGTQSADRSSSALPAVVWVHGEEALLVLEAADATREQARRQGVMERQVFEVDRSFKLEALQAELASLSLFAENRLIELRFANKPGKELGEALAAEVSKLDNSIRLLVTSPYLDKASTESAWFKKIDAVAWVCAVFAIDRQAMPEWIAQRLARQKQRCSKEGLQWLSDNLEGNLLAAKQEILKLGLLFPAGEIGLEALQATVLSVSRFDSFDLVAASLAGDASRCLQLLKAIEAEGEPSVLVLSALGNCTRDLQAASEAVQRKQPIENALRGVFWKTRPAYEQAVRRLKTSQIRKALQLAAQADTIIKGIAPSALPHLGHKDAWTALTELTLALCGKDHLIYENRSH